MGNKLWCIHTTDFTKLEWTISTTHSNVDESLDQNIELKKADTKYLLMIPFIESTRRP
jgi:hypothetical protein